MIWINRTRRASNKPLHRSDQALPFLQHSGQRQELLKPVLPAATLTTSQPDRTIPATISPAPSPPSFAELRLELFFEDLQDGAFLADASLRIVAVNAAFCKLWGSDRDELIGQPLAELLSNTDCESDSVSELLQGMPFRGELAIARFRNSPRVVDLTTSRVGSGSYLGLARDLTPQKEIANQTNGPFGRDRRVDFRSGT